MDVTVCQVWQQVQQGRECHPQPAGAGAWPHPERGDTPPRKLESKNFCDRTSVIHHQKRIASGFPGMCDFKSVHGA